MRYLFQAQLAQKKRDKDMDLQAWRQSRREDKTLPSGLDVTLKRVSLLDLAMNGEIPNTLSGMVDEMIDQKSVTTVRAADFPKYAEVINLIVKTCLVLPAMADEPDETHLGVREMPMDDRLFIFGWANEGVEQVAPFRAKQGQPVAAVLDESSLRSETIEDAGDRG